MVLRQINDAEGLIEEVYVSFLALTSGISVLNETSSCIPLFSSDQAEMILKYYVSFLLTELDRTQSLGLTVAQGAREVQSLAVKSLSRDIYTPWCAGTQFLAHL